MNAISSRLCELNGILQKTLDLDGTDGYQDEEEAAAMTHLTHTLAPLSKIGTFDLDKTKPPMSHTMCFCCLTSCPQHTLYCGHIICQRCLEDYSFLSEDGFYRCLKSCPLCHKASVLWKTKVRPPTAGLRILSLDGLVTLPSMQNMNLGVN